MVTLVAAGSSWSQMFGGSWNSNRIGLGEEPRVAVADAVVAVDRAEERVVRVDGVPRLHVRRGERAGRLAVAGDAAAPVAAEGLCLEEPLAALDPVRLGGDRDRLAGARLVLPDAARGAGPEQRDQEGETGHERAPMGIKNGRHELSLVMIVAREPRPER
ncbi:hypothetical protein [Sorangium sp. So ce1182]|uniref:hypothetical protein n=1 Tax=Sorangium sp. So ce1182 TaxID=3133334 RepID=UPI003F5FCB20